MNNAWGNDDHGPGGDPSWLGGKDRGGLGGTGGGPFGDGSSGNDSAKNDAAKNDSAGNDSARSGPAGNGWSSDFGAGGQAEEPPRYEGPEFGDHAGEDPSDRRDGEGTDWTSSFTGADGSGRGGSGSGKGLGPALLGGLSSLVGVGIFAIIAFRSGMDIWWAVLVVGIPVINRLVRRLRKRNRG